MPPPVPPVCDYMENVANTQRYVNTSYFHKIAGKRAHARTASEETWSTQASPKLVRSQFKEPPEGVKEVLHKQPYQLLPHGSEVQQELLSQERTATQRERIRSHLMVASPCRGQGTLRRVGTLVAPAAPHHTRR
jgi:hypothetical protein